MIGTVILCRYLVCVLFGRFIDCRTLTNDPDIQPGYHDKRTRGEFMTETLAEEKLGEQKRRTDEQSRLAKAKEGNKTKQRPNKG